MADPFGVRFEEAIASLKGKLPEVSLAWDSLAGPVHGTVFTVAGAISTDLVRDLQQALVDAKANGTTITEFRKRFDQAVADSGWTYRGKRGWRTRVIFDTNMRSATMAGRWQQLVANADRRPFLQYRTAGDSRVRPQHRQWNGRIYPIADSFWLTHYPPNGWGCRCTVRAFSQADLDSRGLQVSQPMPIKTRTVVDRDGLPVDQVPVGIDPGWDHNVGQSWLSPALALGRKLASLPRELQGILVDKTISPAFQQVLSRDWVAFRAAASGNGPAAHDAQLVGYLDSPTLASLAEAVPELDLKSTAVAVQGSKVDLMARGNPPPGWTAEAVDQLPTQLHDYRAVLWDRMERVLVVVPRPERGAEHLQTVTLRPNIRTRQGDALAVDGLGTAAADALGNAARYVVLSGRVK